MNKTLPAAPDGWSCETIKKLVALKYEEDQFLDYKEFLEDPNKDKYRKKEYKLKIEELLSSFANAKGGFVLFGISNDKIIKGLDVNPNEELNLKLSQIVSNCIPSISFSTKLIDCDGKKILLVKVDECLDKPVQSSKGSFHLRLNGQTLPIPRDYLRDLFVTKEIKKQKYDNLLFEINYFIQTIESESGLNSSNGLSPFYRLRLREFQESLSNYYGYLSEGEQNIIKKINNSIADIQKFEKYFEIILIVQGTKKFGHSFTDINSFLVDEGVSRDFLNSNHNLYDAFNLIKTPLFELRKSLVNQKA